MTLYWAIRLMAVAMVLFALPLFFDLTVSLVGNLRRRRMAAPGGVEIRLAVVVPAYDEEAMIARTVGSLLGAGCAPAFPSASDVGFASRVFVVAHNCTDRTAAEAVKAGAEVVVLDNPRERGKGAALRAGFSAARASGANAFLVVDADSVARPNLVAEMRAAFQAGAAAVQCRYELELPADARLFSLARLRVLAFRGVNVLRARGRAGMGLSAGLFGNGFALTAQTLAQVPFAVDSICEDIEYHAKLVCAGLRVDWVEDTAVYAPLARPGSAQAQQEARWEGGRLRVASMATPQLLVAIMGGSSCALGMLAEAWSLPLSRGMLLLLLMAFMPIHWLHLFALGCLAIAVLYVVQAAFLGPTPLKDLVALSFAPLHLLWKVATTPLVLLHTRRRTAWARTSREIQHL
jgi:cellulose synthase/poly-beta-1,6-N-acetylglucosamine synthase-like glycosyltransferase